MFLCAFSGRFDHILLVCAIACICIYCIYCCNDNVNIFPVLKFGVGVDLVWNKDGYIGTTLSLTGGLGFDDFGIPVGVSGSRLWCDSKCTDNCEVLKVNKPLKP